MGVIKTKNLFECGVSYLKELFENSVYPWDIPPVIHEYITELTACGLYGFKEIEEGIFVGEGAVIDSSARIIAPCVIGPNTEIRPGAYLRGNVITGRGCVIGNSSELKNCVLLDRVQLPHYNYVGDSVLGNGCHMGAGSICSNLKSDGKAVVVHADRDYETGLRKLGALLGDGVDIGSGCVLNPGTVIGKRTSVYPLVALRGVYPENSIVKQKDLVVKRESLD
ncbi:MAG: UDP-N-acetylglucosamine pyrophosphorylase [Clostridia bacterium]|nr:UDP-N-acetylglucosamine pyrophosphorylase [Clostridia bacterium]MBR3805680.1 UDP-N-acetylglucosamine pyrophosphorylase [Clostridia bacterium]